MLPRLRRAFAVKLNSDGRNSISPYLCYVGKNLMRIKERSLGQAFSKACGVSGRRPDLRPQNAGGVNLHAAKRRAKRKVREDFLSHLCDMSAKADIFESITLCQVGGISMRTKERSLDQAFSKACGVSGRRPDLRPQNAGGVNLHAAKRRAKRKVREDFLSHLCDMSAKADIFESITLCQVGGISMRTKVFPLATLDLRFKFRCDLRFS